MQAVTTPEIQGTCVVILGVVPSLYLITVYLDDLYLSFITWISRTSEIMLLVGYIVLFLSGSVFTWLFIEVLQLHPLLSMVLSVMIEMIIFIYMVLL